MPSKTTSKIGNSTSKWQDVYKGSAQGSIIGPLSYNLFSNDMLLVIDEDVEAYNYADDNSLLSSGYDLPTVKQNLRNNVQKVMSWFNDNQMKINPDKFSYMVFAKLNESNNMLLYNSFIECYFNYCSIIWHFCSHHNTYKLEKLQKSTQTCNLGF